MRLQLVADTLGLSGAARIDGYVNVQSGEVAVRAVDAAPDLSPGSLLFKQVRAAGALPPQAAGTALPCHVRHAERCLPS